MNVTAEPRQAGPAHAPLLAARTLTEQTGRADRIG